LTPQKIATAFALACAAALGATVGGVLAVSGFGESGQTGLAAGLSAVGGGISLVSALVLFRSKRPAVALGLTLAILTSLGAAQSCGHGGEWAVVAIIGIVMAGVGVGLMGAASCALAQMVESRVRRRATANAADALEQGARLGACLLAGVGGLAFLVSVPWGSPTVPSLFLAVGALAFAWVEARRARRERWLERVAAGKEHGWLYRPGDARGPDALELETDGLEGWLVADAKPGALPYRDRGFAPNAGPVRLLRRGRRSHVLHAIAAVGLAVAAVAAAFTLGRYRDRSREEARAWRSLPACATVAADLRSIDLRVKASAVRRVDGSERTLQVYALASGPALTDDDLSQLAEELARQPCQWSQEATRDPAIFDVHRAEIRPVDVEVHLLVIGPSAEMTEEVKRSMASTAEERVRESFRPGEKDRRQLDNRCYWDPLEGKMFETQLANDAGVFRFHTTRVLTNGRADVCFVGPPAYPELRELSIVLEWEDGGRVP
jgi:hypothetical protein